MPPLCASLCGLGVALSPLTVGVDLGGIVQNLRPAGFLGSQPSSNGIETSASVTTTNTESGSTVVKSGQTDASKQQEARKDAELAETINNNEKTRNDEEASRSFRENSSKSKSVYFRVDGGTDTQFTSYFYTEDYNEHFARWVKSVSEDPKPYDLKVGEIPDLLRINAYDFFPGCALQCGMDATGSCNITGNLSNGTLFEEEISCDDLKRISSNLETKHNNLADAIHIYVNHGELIPQPRQLLRSGRKGCTKSMLLAQRQAKQIRFPKSITYEFLKTGMAKINLFLPRDIKVYRVVLLNFCRLVRPTIFFQTVFSTIILNTFVFTRKSIGTKRL